MPDVVGLPLDAAEERLEADGFKNREHLDALGERSVFVRSNWVVVGQEPEQGAEVGTRSKVVLSVAKIDDAEVAGLLPEGSPVLAAIRAKHLEAERAEAEREARERAETKRDVAEAAAAREEAEAERRTAAVRYVDRLDPSLRVAQTVLRELRILRDEIARREVTGAELAAHVDGSTQALDQIDAILLASAPTAAATGLAGQHARLVDAVERFRQGALTLLSGDGPEREAAIRRFDDVYQKASDDWDGALLAVYGGTAVEPPLLGSP